MMRAGKVLSSSISSRKPEILRKLLCLKGLVLEVESKGGVFSFCHLCSLTSFPVTCDLLD